MVCSTVVQTGIAINRSENSGSRAPHKDLNRAVYESPRVYRYYRSPLLTPPEVACLLKYQPHIAGRDILDIGVGAGRTTRYLTPLARRYEAIDYSMVMVNYMRKAVPTASVQQMDFRDLGSFDAGSFDFVFASNNVIDALPHEGRMQALRETFRVLRPGGILAFSSHNIRYKNAFSGPMLNWSRNPARLLSNCVEYLMCWWNYVRVAPLRKTTPDYALLNDPGHYYATLHYYAARSTVNSQLAIVGLQLKDVFDTLGQSAPEHVDDRDNSSLLYVAMRPAD
jgi:SAM-dependent methyltransferase